MSSGKYILSFSEIDASMTSVAGGKGANLGELVRSGFPVPSGFCLTTEAWDLFVSSAPEALKESINELDSFTSDSNGKETEIDRIKELSGRCREILLSIPIPDDISNGLSLQLERTDTDTSYAVRSSATAEDLPGFSFAGQQDTYLNIKGMDAVLESVKKCWASLFTDRAVLYRIQNGFSQSDVKLSVVVQRMVFPDSSGILFTADPLTGNRGHIKIDAGFGLGEALVSGLVDPDSYTVDKRNLGIISVDVREKKLAIYPDGGPDGDGGTVKRELDPETAGLRVLTDEQIRELCALAVKVEGHYSTPQDIEWGTEQGKIYILQTRPVTTLFPVPESPRGDRDYGIYISLGHVQVMTAPISPLGRSVLALFFPFGRPREPGAYNPYVVEAGERLYIEITPFLTRKFMRKNYTNALEGVDYLMGRGVRELLEEPGFLDLLIRKEKKMNLFLFFHYLKGLIPGAFKSYFSPDPDARREAVASGIEDFMVSIEKKSASMENLGARLVFLRTEIENLIDIVLPMLGTMLPALVSWKLIGKMVREWVGDGLEEELTAIERGLVGNITTGMDLETGDLTDRLKEVPELAALFIKSGMSKEIVNEGRTIKGAESFYREYDRFMERFGIRGLGEIDIMNKRWEDDPEPLLKIITSHLESEEKGAHRKHFKELTRKAEDAVEKIISRVQASAPGMAGLRRARRIRKLLSLYRGYMPLREHGKYYLMRLFSMVRKEMLAAGDLFTRHSLLSDPDDVWFLEYHEVVDLVEKLDGKHNLPGSEADSVAGKIEMRKARFSRFAEIDPPRVLAGNGTIPRPSYSTEGMPEGALAGMGVSSGVVEGKARIILDPGKEALLKGEILVAPFTDPAWTPLFINAAAVVIEVGGTMTHGSVIAREYGIPAVVSIPGITKKIKTGQTVLVNGDGGFVKILDKVDIED